MKRSWTPWKNSNFMAGARIFKINIEYIGVLENNQLLKEWLSYISEQESTWMGSQWPIIGYDKRHNFGNLKSGSFLNVAWTARTSRLFLGRKAMTDLDKHIKK